MALHGQEQRWVFKKWKIEELYKFLSHGILIWYLIFLLNLIGTNWIILLLEKRLWLRCLLFSTSMYVWYSSTPVIVYTGHNPLVFLNKMFDVLGFNGSRSQSWHPPQKRNWQHCGKCPFSGLGNYLFNFNEMFVYWVCTISLVCFCCKLHQVKRTFSCKTSLVKRRLGSSFRWGNLMACALSVFVLLCVWPHDFAILNCCDWNCSLVHYSLYSEWHESIIWGRSEFGCW